MYDTSGSTLVRGAARRFADADGQGALNLKDMAFSADGTKVAVADAAHGTRLLNTTDLSDAESGYPALPTGATATSVAFSGDGKYLARGASATGATPDLLVQPADPTDSTAPLEFAFEGSLDGDRVVPRGQGTPCTTRTATRATARPPGRVTPCTTLDAPATADLGCAASAF